ncbi:MAG: FAD-dependent oxidoreductase [Candidatus Nealsonbacteria bacterium]|nr:FAD-dependent oxidoreductase [Candidatus Nealsonbacteria bacterium]
MKTLLLSVSLTFALLSAAGAADNTQIVWLEAETFSDTGRWSNDPQHVDLMGSPYLLATGVGKPVADAVTSAKIPADGKYRLWVRCRDWLPNHSPGRFQVTVGGKASDVTFGKADSDKWRWIDGGTFQLATGDVEIRLHDMTGWWGRCDAVVLATGNFQPANDIEQLAAQRLEHLGISASVQEMGPYDVVVVGGGPAGIGAALAAARNGCKVAFVQDRPVLGGNSSSEISVPPMGYIGNPPDRVNVSGIAKEVFPKQGWNNFADSKKIEAIVRAEKNISLFLNTRATGVAMSGKDRIQSVTALNVHTGQRMAFIASRFIDCTGHGWIGYYAGAEYRMGQEARAEFGETLAPVQPGKRTQGNSLYKAVIEDHRPDSTSEPIRTAPGNVVKYSDKSKVAVTGVPFDCPAWAYQWKTASDFETGGHRRIREIRRPGNYDVPSRGKGRSPGNSIDGAIVHSWWIEYGGMLNTIDDAEAIRDELLRITLGMWNYAKNYNPATVERNKFRELVWINYVPGVRESRRLVGDYMMNQQDYDKQTVHPDTVAFTDWGPDVHHPEGFWVKGNDCIHVYQGRRTSIPYRTLYSKNIENLFMAGRCHSATHIALGGTRVMRPMCATGQAAGTAAAIAQRHATTSRGVYESHIEELQQALLKDGCYLMGVKNADPADLARIATASASSEAPGAAADNVNNGWNRVLGKDRNAWAPDPASSDPQWVQLQLPEAAEVDTVHLTFEQQCASCRVQVRQNDAWRTVATIQRGAARRTAQHFSPVKTDKLRVLFDQPSQIDAVCEIRMYRGKDK